MNQQQRTIGVIGFYLALMACPAWAETAPAPVLQQAAPPTAGLEEPEEQVAEHETVVGADIPVLSQVEQPVTTLDQWSVEIAQAIAQITAIRLNTTADGVELVLETPAELAASSSVVGNALIVDIANATLALAEGEEFQAANPAEGIAYISAMTLDDRTVRISITGSEAAPQANVSSTAAGLVIGLTPGLAVTEAPEDAPLRVVVTATRTEEELLDVPRSVTVVTREEIEEQATLSRDLQDVLSFTVPGFGPPSGRAFSDTSSSFRGRAPLVLIDGIPQTTNGSSFFGRELRTIDPAAIERIEVVRGPSAVYGQGGTGGVINIITRQPDQAGTTGSVEAGISAALGSLPSESFGNYFGAGFSVDEDAYDAVFNFSREDTGVDFDGEGDRIPTVQGTSESETYNLYGRLGWDVNERERLQFTANHYESSRNTDAISDPIINNIPGLQKPRALVFEEGIEFIGADPQIDRNTLVSLSYTNDDLWGSQVQGQLYYRDNEVQSDPRDRRVRNQGIFQGRLELENWGTRLQVDSSLSESLSLLWGVDYSQEESNSTRNLFDGDIYDASGGRIYQKIDEILVVPPYTLDSLGLFAQAQWDVSDRIALQGGLRYERFDVSVGDYTTLFGDDIEASSGSFSDIVFNLGGLYRVTDDLSLFASFAQGYSVPSFADALFFPSAGFQLDQNIQNLQPQKVNNFEVGLRGEWDTVQASLAGFYNQSDLDSAFVDLDEDNFYEIERVPRQVYGLEATVDWQPAQTWLLGSTLSWAEGNADFSNDDDGYLPLSGFDLSPLKATVYVENQTAPGWRNRLQLLLVGRRDRAFNAGIDDAPVSSYAVLDYIGGVQLGPGELQIGIRNLLGSQYYSAYDQLLRVEGLSETSGTPAPGRTITIGYRATF